MNLTKYAISLTVLLLIPLSYAQAQGQKKPEPAASSYVPMIRSLSVHNPTPAYLIEADEKSDEANKRAETFLKAGNTDAALASFREALSYWPQNSTSYLGMAHAYEVKGQLDQAVQTYRILFYDWTGKHEGSSIMSDPANLMRFAQILSKTGQQKEAISVYNHAASLLDYQDSQNHGGKPHLRVLLPEIVMERTLPDQVRYTPERLQALADAALAYEEYSFGSDKEAIAYMKEAVKLYPDSGVIQYYLGEALSGSYYVYLDSPVKDKAAAWATYQEDEKAMPLAYQKAVELGDDATVSAAKERIEIFR